MANPDGTFTLHSDLRPIRVKRGQAWKPVDTTLTSTPDGRLAPAAAAVDVSFSGGGITPLVTLRNGDKAVSLTWPTALPAPTVSHNTAVYPNVMPGVDLQVTAQADSYSEVLVVHDATAAANPALSAIHLTATGTGLTVTTKDGGLSAQDSTGTEVFHGPAPKMWDSTKDATSTPSATDPGSGRVTPLTISTTTPALAPRTSRAAQSPTTELTITTDRSTLTGPGVNYPLFIDPSMSGGTQHWLVVSSGPTSEHIFDDPNWPMQVGYCTERGCNGIGTARSYFQIDTSPLTQHNGKRPTIYSAYFYANEIHQTSGCTDEPVDLHEGGAFDGGTRWGGPLGALVNRQYSHAGDGCGGAGNVVFDAITAANWAADNNWSSIALALTAANESDGAQWKKFDTHPRLDVTFNFPPNPATNLHMAHAVTCTGHVVVPDAYPTIYASATDNNIPPLDLGLWYQIWDPTGSKWIAGNGVANVIANGTEGSWSDGVQLGDGDYAYKVDVENVYAGNSANNIHAGWSALQPFTVHAAPITQTPTIASTDFPPNYWGAPQNTPATFTLHANGAANIVGFTYSFTGAGTEAIPGTGDCDYNRTFATNGGWAAANAGNATVTVPSGLSPGYHTLTVRSFDDAHKLSPESSAYSFYVSPNVGVTTTKLEAENAQQVTVTQPTGQNVAISTQSDASLWSGGAQLFFPGTAQKQSFTLGITAPLEADYALGTQLTQAPDYGQLSLTLDGTIPLGRTDRAPFDAYAPSVATSFLPLGAAHLTKGSHTLTVTLAGTNPASTGNRYQAGVDALTVVPINQVAASSITDAMNNHGIAVDNTTPGNLDLGSGAALSAQSLADAGLAPGKVVTVSGATFTMPASNSATGNDNVVAASQTIPLPATQQGHASAIGFLATSTCGATPAVTGTIGYADGSHTNAAFPSVPDWVSGPADSAAAVLSHGDTGSSPTTARPKIYAIFVPALPDRTVTSVTLPNIGTSFMPGQCSNALHILAIAPRPVQAGWLGAWAAPADPGPSPAGTTANTTIRIVVHPTATGDNARIKLSNIGVPTPTTIDAATLAAQTGTGAATLGAPVQLSFCGATGKPVGCGQHSITLPAGGEAYSDPVPFPATTTLSSNNLVVSLHLPTAVTWVPTHAALTTPSFRADGDATTSSDGTPFTTTGTIATYLSAVDVSTTNTAKGTVAVLGDQTSAAGSTGGSWVDRLPGKLGDALPGSVVNTSISGHTPTGWWKLAGNTGTDAAGQNPLSTSGGVSWSADHGGSAVFDGRTGKLTSSHPALDTTASYSVSAWVNLKASDKYYTAVGQSGTNAASFYLQYNKAYGAWTFVSPSNDSTSPSSYPRVQASGAPALNTWTHLVGVYDAATATMKLYVNGVLVGTASNTTPWTATGPLTIGAVSYGNGSSSDFFNGSISDVRAYQHALTDADAAVLFAGGPATGPAPGIGAASAANAVAMLNHTTLGEPNLRTVVVDLGTNDILAGASADSVERNLTTLLGPNDPRGLKNQRRPDGSLVHVILTTIAPLGLDPNDPREKTRQQLNADILTRYHNYFADDVLDLDKTVRDTTNTSQIAARYLAGNTPNDSYYDALAQALANAVNTLPPEAQL
ncbi:LamG-like jellyroll fold domain-containing protein [Kutzneria albida]|uniref:LamG-like jellyroll fold domain-containing protein n=1 Tax=Kutzneria albida DSM 43870 TaxID=1449976 RepID=W5WKG6_9PSEU|nr:LamG-like jellyroll fold domain-containing protein [Kutzneria albida]AHH98644.1 hypothetical protein KALB_5282 [Kutzneria albida DSM 43870]